MDWIIEKATVNDCGSLLSGFNGSFRTNFEGIRGWEKNKAGKIMRHFFVATNEGVNKGYRDY